MTKTIISTNNAPAAIGPYSQAVVAGGLVFVSGQLGIDPKTSALVPGSVTEQARQAFDNIETILNAAGSGLDKVLKTTLLLEDMVDFTAVNAIYHDRFPKDPPARAAFSVTMLPLKALVEIEAIATVD